MTAKELLKKLISLDSQLSRSNRDVVFFLANLLKKREAKIALTEYKSAGVKRYNLEAQWNSTSSERPLIFSGHTDTVNAASSWKTNPFLPKIRNGRLYGLGASDMKGSIAAFISTILKTSKFSRPVTLMLDGDEEGDGLGGRLLTKKRQASKATVIIGEATDGALRLGQKECYDLKIIIRGTSQHASLSSYQFNARGNAIIKMSRVIDAIRTFEKKVDTRQDAIYKRSTLSYGLISGGTSVNSSADKAELVVNRRLIPGENFKNDYQTLKRVVWDVDPSAEMKIGFYGGPYNVDKKTPWAKSLLMNLKKLTGRNIPVIYRLGWTEASLFKNWGRVFIMGPGTSNTIHKPNESISLRELERTRQIYQLFIKNDYL
jgi:acetylornithine deacetylase/succinyl-diaminopimelate desuccinylase-like protein